MIINTWNLIYIKDLKKVLAFQVFWTSNTDKKYVIFNLFRRTGDENLESLLSLEEKNSLISYLIAFDSLSDHIIAKWSLSNIC